VKFDQREVVYDFGELDEVALGIRHHYPQSQGSEFPAVVNRVCADAVITSCSNATSFYNPVSRGKKLVVVVGDTA